jgi:hypothetical protein
MQWHHAYCMIRGHRSTGSCRWPNDMTPSSSSSSTDDRIPREGGPDERKRKSIGKGSKKKSLGSWGRVECKYSAVGRVSVLSSGGEHRTMQKVFILQVSLLLRGYLQPWRCKSETQKAQGISEGKDASLSQMLETSIIVPSFGDHNNRCPASSFPLHGSCRCSPGGAGGGSPSR